MRITAAILAVAAVTAAPRAMAQDELEQRIRILERRLELAEEQKQAKARESASASAGDKGFGLKSADGAYEFRLKGLLQADGRFFVDDARAFDDTFLLRRVEPNFELTLGTLAFFKLQPQFAGDAATVADVYGELRFDPAFGLRFGKFKTPLGLEYLQGSAALAFIERGLPTEVAGGRDLGLQLQGEVFGGTTSYALAWLDGAPDGRDAASSDTDDRKELAARLFVEPFGAEPGFFQHLGFGIAGTKGRKLGATADDGVNAASATAAFNNTLPRYRSPGQHTVFSYRSNAVPTDANTVVAAGDHTRLSPQLYFYRGSFGLLGEHVVSQQAVALAGAEQELEHTAQQVVVSYVLTGEDASYKGVKPAAAYAVGASGWGALEVAVRLAALDIDDATFPVYANPDTAVSEVEDVGVALSWYPSAHARVALNYDRTTFSGGAPLGADREDEKAFFTRLQLTF